MSPSWWGDFSLILLILRSPVKGGVEEVCRRQERGGFNWWGDGVLVGCEGGGLMGCKVVGLAGVQAV